MGKEILQFQYKIGRSFPISWKFEGSFGARENFFPLFIWGKVCECGFQQFVLLFFFEI